MAIFYKNTTGFTECCGARYVPKGTSWENNPGVLLSFEKPFDVVEGEECVTLDTSKGVIYFRFLITHKAAPPDALLNPGWLFYSNEDDEVDHKDIEWIKCVAMWYQTYPPIDVKFRPPKPGIYVMIRSIPRSKPTLKHMLQDLGEMVIYQSPDFHNRYHPERGEVSLQLIVFEVKE